jgi:hypothetical protein
MLQPEMVLVMAKYMSLVSYLSNRLYKYVAALSRRVEFAKTLPVQYKARVEFYIILELA